MRTTVLLVGLLVAVAGAFEDWPLMCISNPPMQLVAGITNVSVTNENFFERKCRALLEFADPDFAPVTYSFTSTSPCPGSRETNLPIPLGSPNGDARVIWQCHHSSSCNLAVISNGTRSRSLIPEQNGTIACLPLGFGANTSSLFSQLPQSSSVTGIPISAATSKSSLDWNSTNTTNRTTPTPTVTPDVNSATQVSIPSWKIFTITHTITTLLTTTLTS
ncbi:uncharacterized protein F4807DRAFT_173486 [Annulohypoxylon truncatum]|uniref:uncharacterized protein n=1 Tax=Annulohypoxylon truncatum TaxID=327061 RepID=UPI0020074031|nr:uncharacterized protein F4807DRAFT_173486 [Annulohypoxylon truncatum]KAI1207648.1 hypothetical protein F4807DRAFT_173486 [Annulohypoxylon truncatum]